MRLSRQEKKLVKEARKEVLEALVEDGSNKDLQEQYRIYDEMLSRKWKISPDTLTTVGGSLLSILLILNFEKMDILRSKAVGFILRGRV